MSTSGIVTMVLFSVPSPPHTPSHLSSRPPPTPLCLLHHHPHKKAASTSLTPWLLGSPPAPHQAFLHWKANLSSMHGWVPRVLAQSRPGHCPELEGIAMDWKAESLGRCFKVEEGRAMNWKGDCNRDAAWGFKLLQALWLGLVLVWNNAFETRRSFLMSSFNRQVLDWLTQCSKHSAATSQFGVLGQKESANLSTRRIALVLPFVAVTSPALNSIAAVAPAKKSDFGNSLLRNLGIGDADIYYPRIFEGLWSCYSTLVAVDTPQGEDKADQRSVEFARKQLGYTVEYKARFIPFGKYVIGDRLFTTMSLVESTVGKNLVDHGIWSPDQPNRLTLILRGALKVENYVTKRFSSLSGAGQFDTSEYSQQVFDNATIQGGPPTVKASQNRTRYRWDPTTDQVSNFEAFQRVAMFPVPKEGGFTGMDVLSMDKPVTVYKYILRFTRDPI